MFLPWFSKSNQKLIDGWAFIRSTKISHHPVYYACIYSQAIGQSGLRRYKGIVVKEPRYSTRVAYTTPVIYTTAFHTTESQALADAVDVCTGSSR